MKIYQIIFCLSIMISCSSEVSTKNEEEQANKYMINDTLCDCTSLDIDRKRNIIKIFNEETPYTGWCVLYLKNGVLKEKRQYKAGKLNGYFITYFENGNIESSIPHNNNRYNGLYYKLNETGDTTYQRMYKNGAAIN